MNNITFALISSVSAAFLWGVSPLLFDRIKASSYIITLLRNSATVIFIISYILLNNINIFIHDLNILIILILLGVSGPALADQIYIASMKRIGVNLSTAISYTYVFWASIISQILSIENITLFDVAGSLIAFLGLGIGVDMNRLSFEKRSFLKEYVIGIFLALVSGVFCGLATVLSKIAVTELSFEIIIFYRSLTAIAIMILITWILSRKSFVQEYRNLRWRDLTNIFLSGLLSFLIAYYFFLTALQDIGVVIPSIISLSSPLVTLTLYYLTRREKIEKRLVIGVSLITIGSIVSTMKYLVKI